MKELDSFTVERLEKWINTPEKYDHRYSPRINCDELRSLARIALAAKRAEPVAYRRRRVESQDRDWIYSELKFGGGKYMIEQSLYTTPQLNSPEIPDGWPTEDMVIAGFESGAWDALSSAVLKRQGWPYSCRESAECVTGIFRTMIAAAPEKENG